jgi:hypothetical protein
MAVSWGFHSLDQACLRLFARRQTKLMGAAKQVTHSIKGRAVPAALLAAQTPATQSVLLARFSFAK